ncbi:MAG: alpha/beta hydrolase [Actinomycetota bacterium]
MHVRIGRFASLLALLAVAAAACATAADENPLASATSTTTSTPSDETTTTAAEPGAFTPAPIDWDDCRFGDCATVEVPLDYDDPTGRMIELAVARAPASGQRIGALFFNPGGPGATATDFVSVLGDLLPSEINERFDLVGIDPRGVGDSNPIECGVDPVDLYAADPTIETPQDREALLEVSEDYVDDCTIGHGDVLPFVGTRDLARDIDSVRAAMGDAQISFLGFSYGTAIGQVYADLFPTRVRSMILDGVLELGPTGLELAADQAAGFETALARWVEYCNGAEGCETAGGALQAVEQVLAEAEQPGGIPASGGGRPLGPGEAALGISLALYSQSLWNDLDAALAAALDGDGSELVELADRYIGLGSFEIYFAVNCMDFAWPSGDPDAFFSAAKATAATAPHFGEALVNDYVRCVDWPVPPDPLPATSAPGAPPILVVSTTGDPATPYEAGVAVAERLESGVLVTNEGDGHTVVADGNRCIDDIVVAYLVDGVVPADGATCR